LYSTWREKAWRRAGRGGSPGGGGEAGDSKATAGRLSGAKLGKALAK